MLYQSSKQWDSAIEIIERVSTLVDENDGNAEAKSAQKAKYAYTIGVILRDEVRDLTTRQLDHVPAAGTSSSRSGSSSTISTTGFAAGVLPASAASFINSNLPPARVCKHQPENATAALPCFVE